MSHSPIAAHVVHTSFLSTQFERSHCCCRTVGAPGSGVHTPQLTLHAPCMYFGLFSHSPSAAQPAHPELSSTHALRSSGGGGGGGGRGVRFRFRSVVFTAPLPAAVVRPRSFLPDAARSLLSFCAST